MTDPLYAGLRMNQNTEASWQLNANVSWTKLPCQSAALMVPSISRRTNRWLSQLVKIKLDQQATKLTLAKHYVSHSGCSGFKYNQPQKKRYTHLVFITILSWLMDNKYNNQTRRLVLTPRLTPTDGQLTAGPSATRKLALLASKILATDQQTLIKRWFASSSQTNTTHSLSL